MGEGYSSPVHGEPPVGGYGRFLTVFGYIARSGGDRYEQEQEKWLLQVRSMARGDCCFARSEPGNISGDGKFRPERPKGPCGQRLPDQLGPRGHTTRHLPSV